MINNDGLVRLRLDLSYDGAEFAGWAVQPGQRTVLGVLVEALKVVVPQSSSVTVAGRTDAGVHAIGQVAHLDVPTAAWAGVRDLLARLAGLLPADLRVREVREVLPAFDARFAALWRRYRYRVTDAPWGVEPLRRSDTLHWNRVLDAEAMQGAAAGMLGIHDFAAYCRRRENATTIRDLHHLTIERTGHLLEVEAQADAFGHSMVRSLVGALLAVGDGRRSPDWASLHVGAVVPRRRHPGCATPRTDPGRSRLPARRPTRRPHRDHPNDPRTPRGAGSELTQYHRGEVASLGLEVCGLALRCFQSKVEEGCCGAHPQHSLDGRDVDPDPPRLRPEPTDRRDLHGNAQRLRTLQATVGECLGTRDAQSQFERVVIAPPATLWRPGHVVLGGLPRRCLTGPER